MWMALWSISNYPGFDDIVKAGIVTISVLMIVTNLNYNCNTGYELLKNYVCGGGTYQKYF